MLSLSPAYLPTYLPTLGEFGYLIAEELGTGGEAQFQVLHKHFSASSNRTKAVLLSTYVKLENLYLI